MKKIIFLSRIFFITAMLLITFACKNDKSDPDAAEQVLVLEPVATFANSAITESSGIVKSKKHTGIFWTHNDSGGGSKLYPVYEDGISHTTTEIIINGATNIDWEDIIIDDDINPNIYVADIGNNAVSLSALLAGLGFDRTDLCLYKIPEPDPISDVNAAVLKIPFHYPVYTPKYDSDAEAVFWARDTVYLLTKQYSTPGTSLYRFNSLAGGTSTELELRSSFDTQGCVTAADTDASANGNRLVVLANVYAGYASTAVSSSIVWLFEVTSGDDYFNGTKYRLSIDAGQCEGICFIDSNTLLITNEEGELFKLNISQLKPYN